METFSYSHRKMETLSLIVKSLWILPKLASQIWSSEPHFFLYVMEPVRSSYSLSHTHTIGVLTSGIRDWPIEYQDVDGGQATSWVAVSAWNVLPVDGGTEVVSDELRQAPLQAAGIFIFLHWISFTSTLDTYSRHCFDLSCFPLVPSGTRHWACYPSPGTGFVE